MSHPTYTYVIISPSGAVIRQEGIASWKDAARLVATTPGVGASWPVYICSSDCLTPSWMGQYTVGELQEEVGV